MKPRASKLIAWTIEVQEAVIVQSGRAHVIVHSGRAQAGKFAKVRFTMSIVKVAQRFSCHLFCSGHDLSDSSFEQLLGWGSISPLRLFGMKNHEIRARASANRPGPNSSNTEYCM
jgi:hypothetical protein